MVYFFTLIKGAFKCKAIVHKNEFYYNYRTSQIMPGITF